MAVVNHYDTHFVLNLSEQQKTDLAEFLEVALIARLIHAARWPRAVPWH